MTDLLNLIDKLLAVQEVIEYYHSAGNKTLSPLGQKVKDEVSRTKYAPKGAQDLKDSTIDKIRNTRKLSKYKNKSSKLLKLIDELLVIDELVKFYYKEIKVLSFEAEKLKKQILNDGKFLNYATRLRNQKIEQIKKVK